MGYYIREGLVEEHRATLDMIHAAVVRGEAISFRCAHPKEMSRMKYQFNRVLRAAQILTKEAGGRFTNLRLRVEVREDWEKMRIVIKPKRTGSTLITEIKPSMPDEKDVLIMIEAFDGEQPWLEFTPSSDYDFDGFKAQVEARGFDLNTHIETGAVVIIEGNNGKLTMAATRKKRVSSSSMLRDLGFGRTE